MKIVLGILLTILFLVLYRIAYISKGWPIYLWTAFLIGISISATILYGYVYFAFFLAYLIGNKKDRMTFLILYIVHLVITTISINVTIVLQEDFFLKQLPFVIITWISVILLPFSIHNKNERGQLVEKLEDANKRISDLSKLEERQRIARDLHDTLGQKLSLIGLKSDLARKIIYKDPEQALNELKDVQQTARTALNELRKIVSQMRGIRIKDELIRVKQILNAAQIHFVSDYEIALINVPLLTENIISMCLKEAVTNVVKHSQAKNCFVSIEQTKNEVIIIVKDDGIGCSSKDNASGYGLLGIRERLEFVNGTFEITNHEGTVLTMKVLKDGKLNEKEN
jgi:two-component system sensor histidine kinase DesK